MIGHWGLWMVIVWAGAVNVHCAVRITNQITTTSPPERPASLQGPLQLTTTLCSDASVNDSAAVSGVVARLQRMTGHKFYLTQTDIPADQKDVWFLGQFNRLLALPARMGLHSLVVQTNNFSISQLEEALTYAWAPSFEAYLSSPVATAEDAPHIRFLSFLNSSETLPLARAASRFQLTRIIYTILLSNATSAASDSQTTSQNAPKVNQPAQRITAPSAEVLTRRLADKGLHVYDQLLIPAHLVGVPLSEDIIRSNDTVAYMGCANLSANRTDASCKTPNDVEVSIGAVATYFLVSQVNGSYTQQETNYFSCLTFANNKVWAGWLLDQNASVPGAYRPPVGDHYLVQPQHSFRVYTSRPVHFQKLPIIQKLFSEKLRQNLVYGQTVDVILWNPDLDTGTELTFLVQLKSNQQVVAELDARLLYADAIYKRLEKAFGSGVMWPEYPFTRELYISRQPIVQNRTLERECIGDADDAEQQRSGKKLQYIDACRMQETFSIVTVTETSDPKLAPSSDTVQRAVSLAFAQANPLTVGNASFSVKLTKRERLLPTFPYTVFRKGVSNQEPQVYRFTFSFSYVNLPRGKFWNIWRFPTDEIRQTLSALIPRIRSYHPFMSFTMYSSEPINVQLLPRLQETIKERLRVFHKYDESDVIIWDPDLNGTVVKFFVKNDRLFSSGIVDPRPDMGNDWVYREVGRLKFARNSMYHASDNNDALTLSQNKPRTDDGKQQLLERCRQEATVAASTACPLPANFSVFLMRKAGYGAPEILDTDAVLAGIVDAFAEANPVSMDGLDLNIALTGRSDGFLTAQGEPVVKFEFAATYREMETGNLWNFWRYPDDKILNNNLYNACAMVATMPFY